MPEQVRTIKNTDAMGSDEGQLVVFRLSDEEFGVTIEKVKEIVRLPEITPIPRSPDYVAGICNLRGSVLPAIDTRTRFSMESQDATDHTRLLVVETGGIQTGLIVDSVREVMRLQSADIEPPPSVCRGVDREFLSGVVKVDEGKRLILNLDLSEVVAIEEEAEGETRVSDSVTEEGSAVGASIEEEQLVSFNVADEAYAFHIDRVREILKIDSVTAVPNVPDYVKGLFTIRNMLLPILDLRGLLGFSSLLSEQHAVIDEGITEHRVWMDNLDHVLGATSRFTGIINAKETSFGKWLETFNTSSVEVETIMKRLKRARGDLFNQAAGALKIRETNPEDARTYFEDKVKPLLPLVIDVLEEFKNAMALHISEDQRVLVVETGAMTVGYLVDGVDEVLRIPKSVIDETPAMASSDRKELKAVAKMEEGARLIMIMDESALVSSETTRMLKDIKIRAGGGEISYEEEDKRSLVQQSLDEEQLVTFGIDDEEYGIRIMQVQEINRISDIISVPRAPYSVEGMTNLRGSVIPVIDIRKLFGMAERDMDDRTRIIIVDIDGSRTGLRVDRVHEVLRLGKKNIDMMPSIVTTDGVNNYIEGVCRINDGKRIVMLLNVEKILSEDELKSLSAIGEAAPKKEAKEKKGTEKTEPVKAGSKRKKPEKYPTGKKKPVKGKKLEIAE